jgi:hypothetical protein
MKIAVVIFDRVSLVSFSNIFYALNGFDSKYSVSICAFKGEVVDEFGLRVVPQIFGESLYGYDAVIVPDGVGALSLRYDEIFLSWIRSASRAKLKIGLDLGSLLLGGAGFLQGKAATIRAGYKNALKEYCEFIEMPIYQNGDVISISECNKDSLTLLEKILNV